MHRFGSLLLLLLAACATATDAERQVAARERATNGISVSTPTVYDDSVLQQQLASLQARLASLSVIDQASIIAHLGNVSGARQDISSVAISAAGLPTPSIATTGNGATQQTVTAPTGTTITSALPVQNTVTTIPSVSAAVPTSPAASTALPTTFSVAASEILNEQVQLSTEIANLTLLLDGSLSDRVVTSPEKQTFVRPRLTIGFPIQLTPDRRFTNAVAVVEVEVVTDPKNDFSGTHERPAVTALLPREKTYNVAAIKDSNVSLGAGIVTQVATVGVSLLRGTKSYYIVKDQDTLANRFTPTTAGGTGFGWQFRPVLGRAAVTGEPRQTYVQLAFPGSPSAEVYGTLHLRTYWRTYDRQRDIVGGIIPGSLNDKYDPVPVPGFEIKMTQDVTNLTTGDVEDLGNGQVLVSLRGRFATGSVIRIGNNILQPGTGMTMNYNLLRVVAPTADLATKRTVIVSRDGTETPIRINNKAINVALAGEGLQISDPIFTTIDEATTRVQLDTNQEPFAIVAIDPEHPFKVQFPPLVVVLGGKVFGYSDAPITRDGKHLSLVVPTALLTPTAQLTVKPLLADEKYAVTKPVFAPTSEPERLVLVGQQSNTLTYLLYGHRLTSMTVVSPPEASISDIGKGFDSDNVRAVRFTSADAAHNNKSLVVQRLNERPFLIAIPPLTDPPKQPLKFRERIAAGADEAIIIGDGADDLDTLLIGTHTFTLEHTPDFVRVAGLAAFSITGTARVIDCTAVTKAGKKVPLQLEVVTTKVENIPH
jgi:hypothetical protein